MKTTNADKWFSRFIRLRDSDENGIGKCCTCGAIKEVKNMDCGHFIGRQHMQTRFSTMNAHVQCKRCNGFEEGRKAQYKEFLIEKYGIINVNLLEVQGYKTKKYSAFEMKEIEKYYKEETNKLIKEKNIQKWW